MNFLCLAYYDREAMASAAKSEIADVVKQCRPHDEALRATGHLRLQAALGASGDCRVVRPNRRADQPYTDGPFSEAKEVVGGFFIIEAADMDEAVRIASLHPAGQIGEQLGWGLEIWPIRRMDQYDK
jgi:hypothetical protein